MTRPLSYGNQSIDLRSKLNCGGSKMVSPDLLQEKRATINPKSDDSKCFKYAKAVALIYKEIISHHEKNTNLEPFTKQYKE